jgi:energy-coupling factor transporter ATP-binding protein EcfA2
MGKVTFKAVRHQLFLDLIGKDSYRGVTLTYAWLANQFGHFSLGFIPALLLTTVLAKYTDWQSPELCGALIISIAWFSFECFNFLGPLLLFRSNKSMRVRYTFRPFWLNIAFDTGTDVLYFILGAFTSSFLFQFHTIALWVVVIDLAVLTFCFWYWYRVKLYIQKAYLPFQYRLSQCVVNINPEEKKIIEDFIRHPKSGSHLLVFGPKGSGKTSLAVGLATELAIQKKACTYATAMKLFVDFYVDDSDIIDQKDVLWSWRTADLLVIDDINPGDPVRNDLLHPNEFMTFLDRTPAPKVTVEPDLKNRAALASRNVIWVLGNDDQKKENGNVWEEMLQKNLGIDPSHIHTVKLKK